jgi:omega-hydroxy-beta-dihydromenaquinone-9 sulfotransferase
MMSNLTKSSKSKSRKLIHHSYPFWSPRFWHGMLVSDWVRMLVQYRFRVHPLRVPMAFMISGCTLFNSTLHLFQRWRYAKRLEQIQVDPPPVFIIGHWRSGTTMLHELLVRDPQFAYPTTYECFAPSHFLASEWIVPRVVGCLLPKKRPMDNMSAGFDYPQEDEFALVNMGCPSPYLKIAFPNDPPRHMELLDMQGVDDHVLARWKHDMLAFAKALTLAHGKRLVLKSPPHTGRVEVLSRLFPGAKFIHISRHPEDLFASSRRLWKTLWKVQALQIPHCVGLDEYIFECFERMYGGFLRQRDSIPEGHLYDVKYEDLVRDPVGQIAAMYRQLDLGDFEAMRPELESLLQQRKGYQPNRHEELEPEIREQIRRRWAEYYELYDYANGSLV